MNDQERLEQIHQATVDVHNLIIETEKLIEQWLIAMENRLNAFGENPDV